MTHSSVVELRTGDASAGEGAVAGHLRWLSATGIGACLAILALGIVAVDPASLAAQQGPRTHVVKKGDTLWDLAARYLSNPFQWPAIYQLNRSLIENPHWIYPGQEFRIPPAGQDATRVAQQAPPAGGASPAGGAAAAQATPTSGPRPTPATGQQRAEAFSGPSIFDHSPEETVNFGTLSVEKATKPQLVSPSDFYRTSFVTEPANVGAQAVTARVIRENPLGLELPPSVRPHDRIVIALHGLSVSAGDLLQAVRAGEGRGAYGRQYASLGLVRVTAVDGDSARAVVETIYGDYQVGDPLVPAGSFADPGTDLEPVRGGMVAHILGFETEQPLLSNEDIVFLDRGAVEGVRDGDEFAVFSQSVRDPSTAPVSMRLSVVRVIRAMPHTASARVVETRDVGSSPDAPARLIRRPAAAGG